MAYTIVKSDGTVLTTIADGTINTTSTSLGLPGRNYAGYGQSLDTNFVHITENFADSNPPPNSLRGQLWYNTNNDTLYVCPTDGLSNGLAWTAIATSGGNASSTFGAVNVTGNLTSNNLTVVNGVYADTGTLRILTITSNAVIADASITTANIGTLTTQNITTGSSTTPGTMTGTWTVSGGGSANGLGGTSMWVTNGNLVVTGGSGVGIKTDNYYYANGVAINFGGTYSNSNVASYLPTYGGNLLTTTTTTTTLTTGANTTPGVLTGNWTLSSGSVLNGTVIQATTLTTGSTSIQGNLTGNWTLTSGSQFNATSIKTTGLTTGANTTAGSLTGTWSLNGGGTANGVANTSLWITNGNLVITGSGSPGIRTDNYYYANGTPINFAGSYGDSNVRALLPNYGGTINTTVVTTGSNAAVGTITGAWSFSTGSTLNAPTLFSQNLSTGSNVTNGTLTGTWTLNGGGTANSVAGTSLWITNGNLVITGSGSPGIRTDNYYYANGTPINFAGTYGNANVANYLPTYTGTVGTGAAIFYGTALTTGANTTAGTITGTWTLSAGSKLNATYADLAERFEADTSYEPGTVVELGGEKEITAVQYDLSEDVFGVISDTAGYLMNAAAGDDYTHPPVAVGGRVKVKVIGTVRKGQRLVSAGNGLARGAQSGEATSFNTIGRCLTTKTDDTVGFVEAYVTINK